MACLDEAPRHDRTSQTNLSLTWPSVEIVLLTLASLAFSAGRQRVGFSLLLVLVVTLIAHARSRSSDTLRLRRELALAVVVGMPFAFVAVIWRVGPVSGRMPWATLLLAVVAIAALMLLVFPRRLKADLTNEIGLALVTGVVLAGAAFVINLVLADVFDERDRSVREAELRSAINTRGQLIFRGQDFSQFELSRCTWLTIRRSTSPSRTWRT